MTYWINQRAFSPLLNTKFLWHGKCFIAFKFLLSQIPIRFCSLYLSIFQTCGASYTNASHCQWGYIPIKLSNGKHCKMKMLGSTHPTDHAGLVAQSTVDDLQPFRRGYWYCISIPGPRQIPTGSMASTERCHLHTFVKLGTIYTCLVVKSFKQILHKQ